MASEEELRRALKAFKKRLKLTQLDDESRLGVGAVKTGRSERIVSIRPPAGFPPEIWEELVARGFLRRDTAGFYELADGV